MAPFLRLPIVFLLATGTTVSLFRMMHVFIAMGELQLDEVRPSERIEYTRLREDSRAQRRQRDLPTRTEFSPPPEVPEMERSEAASANAIAVAVSAPTIDTNLQMGALDIGSAPANSDETPVVRVEPIYPMMAATRGIEGWVILRFDLTTTGATNNVRVVAAQPKNVFNDAAVRAVRKWKYRPKVLEGKALVTRGLEVKLVFALR